MADYGKISENKDKHKSDFSSNVENLAPKIHKLTKQERKCKRSRIKKQGSTSDGASIIAPDDALMKKDFGLRAMNKSKHCASKQNEILAKLPYILKDFYREDLEVASLSVEDVAHWRRINNELQVKRTNEEESGYESIPNPVLTFEQVFNNYPEILLQIKNEQLLQPSPFQSQSWPILLKGEDLIGIAQNGTIVKDVPILAFVIPAIIHIQGQPIPKELRKRPSVLILTPTKECALKIEAELVKYVFSAINTVCIYENDDIADEDINIIFEDFDVVIGTPGNLKNLNINLTNISYIVLDEVDKMLDMEFGSHIVKVLSDVRPDKQTIMTTTTWSLDVQELVKSYMKNPFQINIKSLDIAPVHTVTHKILFMKDEEKVQHLIEFLKKIDVEEKVVIYCGEKPTVTHITTQLDIKGIECQFLDDMENRGNNGTALEEVITKNIFINVDGLSRGINIKNLSHVVNYDFPRHIEEYIDRVLKIGRAGKPGVSLTFLTLSELYGARDLVNMLEEFNTEGATDLALMAQKIKQLKREEQRRGNGNGNRGRKLRRQRK